MMLNGISQLTVLVLTLTTSCAFAKQVRFESGQQKVTLIELYSSEGCSSCPPADRQLARLRSSKNLFKSFVPIEFHVDYWNYLGWTDPFSNKKFSQRQRSYARAWKRRSVATPSFVVNGSLHSLGTALPQKKEPSQAGNLIVTSSDKNSFEVSFKPSAPQTSDQLQVNASLLGNGLATKVPAGENAGETLQHEFVVLKHKKLSLKKGKDGTYKATVNLDRPKSSKAKSYSVAFWVDSKSSLRPLQAVGGDLP